MRVSVTVLAPLLFCLTACATTPEAAPSPTSATSRPTGTAPATNPRTAPPPTEPQFTGSPSADARPGETRTDDAQPGESRPAETRTADSAPTASEGRTTRPAAKAGTVCGEVQPRPGGAPMAAVAVLKGRANCAEALRVFRAYYRPQTPKEGTAGVATVAGWECVSNTAAESMRTGRLTSCRKAGTTLVADVIP